MPALPVALLGINVGDIVADMLKALVELIVPDFGADWASQLVTWLVAVPAVTGSSFPALNRFAHDLTAVGFGLLGASFVAGTAQIAAGAPGAADLLKRTAIAAGALVATPVVLKTAILGTNVLTASMIKHPAVVDGLDKAFGEALIVSTITSGIAFGLLTGAALAVLYFLAALFVLKIGLTAGLAVALTAGGLVWGLYPLAQTSWLARTWTATLGAALLVPIAWALIFSAAALLASDTLVFDEGSSFNESLGGGMAALVKPFAAVACFWLAYRAPGFLLGVARGAGVASALLPGFGGGGNGGRPTGPAAAIQRGVRQNRDRFTALAHHAKTGVASRRPAAPNRPSPPSKVRSAASAAARTASAPNTWWRNLASEGRTIREQGPPPMSPGRTNPTSARPVKQPALPSPAPRPRTEPPPSRPFPGRRDAKTAGPGRQRTEPPPARPPRGRPGGPTAERRPRSGTRALGGPKAPAGRAVPKDAGAPAQPAISRKPKPAPQRPEPSPRRSPEPKKRP